MCVCVCSCVCFRGYLVTRVARFPHTLFVCFNFLGRFVYVLRFLWLWGVVVDWVCELFLGWWLVISASELLVCAWLNLYIGWPVSDLGAVA